MKIRRVRTGEVRTLARRVRADMLRRLSARTVLQLTCQGERRIGQQSRATPWRHLGTNLPGAGLPVMLPPKLSQAATQSDVGRVKTRLQFQHWFAARRRDVFHIDNVTGNSLVSGIEGQRAAPEAHPRATRRNLGIDAQSGALVNHPLMPAPCFGASGSKNPTHFLPGAEAPACSVNERPIWRATAGIDRADHPDYPERSIHVPDFPAHR